MLEHVKAADARLDIDPEGPAVKAAKRAGEMAGDLLTKQTIAKIASKTPRRPSSWTRT